MLLVDFLVVSCYLYPMTITQTVDIPESRLLTIEVPREVPTGPVILTFTPATLQEATERKLGFGTGSRIDPAEAVKRCSGIFKRLDIPLSSDDFLAMRQKERELENNNQHRRAF